MKGTANMDMIIKPFVGVDKFKLLSSEREVLKLLNERNLSFSKEIWDNEECTVKVPWTVFRADNSMSFFFAKDKLFKIYMEEGFNGSLQNGIAIGTSIDEAKRIDNTLKYDEWNEDWSSDCGYWLEDSLDTNKVVSLTIFIRELLDDDLFEKYEW